MPEPDAGADLRGQPQVRDVEEDHGREQHVQHRAQDVTRGAARPGPVPPLGADATRGGARDGEHDVEHCQSLDGGARRPGAARSHSLERRRPAEEVALGLVDAELAQQRDASPRRPTCSATVRLPRPRAMPTTAWITSWSVAVARAVAHELAVDLEEVERQVLEVVERAEAGAEVVEREAAAELGQPRGEVLRGAGCSRPRPSR